MTTTQIPLKLNKEELEAAKLEKHALATATIKKYRDRYNELAVQKTDIEKEQEIIKARVAAELKKMDAHDFIDAEGTRIIGFNETNKKQLDMEKVEKKFGENALTDCYTFKKGQSFFSKR
jgi:hypothetical protein